MSNSTVYVLVSTCPYERVAQFGYDLREFAGICKPTWFSWHEAYDEGDPDLADEECDHEDDPNWVKFAVNFQEKADANAYRAWVKDGTLPLSRSRTHTPNVAVAEGLGNRVWTLQIEGDDPRDPDAITHYATEDGALEARREFLAEWLAESFEAADDPRDPTELSDDELLAVWADLEGERRLEIRSSHVNP